MNGPQLTNSAVERLVGFFQFLMILNETTIIFSDFQNLFNNTFLFLLGKYIGEKLLGHVMSVCLTSQEKKKDIFPKWLYYFAFPLAVPKVPVALSNCQQWIVSVLFCFIFPVSAILVGISLQV